MARVKIDEPVQAPDSRGIMKAIGQVPVTVQVRSDSSAATVFADETTGTILTQPLLSDNAGRIPGWLSPGSYSLIAAPVPALGFGGSNQPYEASSGGTPSGIAQSIIDAKGDLLVGTADNTIARLAAGGAGFYLISDPSATCGVRWTAGMTFRVNDPPYNADKTGSADATTAINSAITDANVLGGTVWLDGAYKCNSTIVGKSNVNLIGASRRTTRLNKNFNGDLVTFNGSATGVANHCGYAGLQNMHLDGGGRAFTGALINHIYADDITHRDLYLSGNNGPGIDMAELWDSHFFNVVAEDCGNNTMPAFWVRSSQATVGNFGYSNDTTNVIRFDGCRAESFRNGAFRMERGPSGNAPNKIWVIGESKIESYFLRGAAIQLAGANNVVISDFNIHMGNFDSGYSTPVPCIDVTDGATISLKGGRLTNAGTATISAGVNVWIGPPAVTITDVTGSYSTAPTSASSPHINLAGGGPYYVDASNWCNSNATPLVVAAGVVNVAPGFFNSTKAANQSISGTAETKIQSLKIPANLLQPGSHVRVRARGTISAAAAGTLLARIRAAGADSTADTAVCATAATGSVTTAVGFEVDADITMQTNGSSGTIVGNVKVIVGATLGLSAQTATVVFDQTVDRFVGLYLTGGGTSPVITITNALVEIVRPY